MNLPKSLLSKMHRLSKRDIEKLTKSAKGEECHIRTPYCKSDDSVVFAHLSGKSVLGISIILEKIFNFVSESKYCINSEAHLSIPYPAGTNDLLFSKNSP